MALDDLIPLLNDVVGGGRITYLLERGINPKSFHYRAMRELSAEVPPASHRAMADLLLSADETRVLADAMMQVAGTAWPVDLESLLRWLLTSAADAGAEATVRSLRAVLTENRANGLAIIAVGGLTVEEDVALDGGVHVVPFTQVPQDDISDHLRRVPETLSEGGMARMFYDIGPRPTAAVMAPVELWPLFRPKGEAMSRTQPPEWAALHLVLNSLGLAGPSPVTPLCIWTHIPALVPFASRNTHRRTAVIDILPADGVAGPAVSAGAIQRAARLYASAPEDLRRSLAVPVQRLNLSLKRRSLVDKALELGIALESLLLFGRESHEGVSYAIRERAAYLHGGTLPERKYAFKLAKDLYQLRCDAAHAGALVPAQLKGATVAKEEQRAAKCRERERQHSVQLQEGAAFTAKLILRTLEQGKHPNWDDELLSWS